MRTTVNIDAQLLAEAKVLAARERRTLSDVVEDALRASVLRSSAPRPPVVLPTFGNPGDRPLVDILDREALAEALGENEWPRPDDDADS